jgi:hypothetical protein
LLWLAAIASSCFLLPPEGATAQPQGEQGFASRHPRLFFASSELPTWRARVLDGGADDEAYTFIRTQATDVYVNEPLDSLLQADAAQEPMMNLVLVSHFEASVDTELVNLGRRLTLYIARNWGVDTDPWGMSLRLRAMSLGFDHFFVNATPAERDEIRGEVLSYINYMTTNINFDIWRRRPYVSNKTAMVSASLGLAAICFHDELPASATDAALAAAHDFYLQWHSAHLANDGCYREGSLYVGWSMRNLIFYFAARKRFDGYNYALDPAIRAIEQWVPYELDPRGEGRVNNMNDQTDYFRPLARHTTYWDWAQSEWGSGIAAYMWEHSAGVYGKDMLDENDKAATVLWHTGVAPVNPVTVLPKSRVWEDRGLYCYRSGWPDLGTSNDVVFNFYSGEFRGGHAQEDQNQFTLVAYGEKLILDHGAGSAAKQSEAHNIVRIDGAGQHNAGSSIGTDGRIVEFITNGFSDYVRGDATLAYTTHSPYNNPGVPYPWSNWSWGLNGANPVEHALRNVVSVHGAGAPPYFIIYDDVKKDANAHRYDWCMHAPANATIDISSDPVRVTAGNASLYLYCLNPNRAALAFYVSNFDNGNEDPNSRLLTAAINATNPNFKMLLLPLPVTEAAPQVQQTTSNGGVNFKITWENGLIDEVVVRPVAPGQALGGEDPFPWAIDSNAPVAVVRKSGPSVMAYTLVDGTWLTVGGVLMAAVDDGPASLVFDGTDVHVSRVDAQFRVRADAVQHVYYHGAQLPAIIDGEFLVRGVTTDVPASPTADLQLRSFPNPFNPAVQISFVNPARGRVDATIYDAVGRRVRTIAAADFPAGPQTLTWDGRDEAARTAASGVYFLRLHAAGRSAATKLVLLR